MAEDVTIRRRAGSRSSATHDNNEDNDVDESVRKSLKFLPKLMLSQVAARVVTFVLNAILIRYVSRDSLGIINVRLLLIYTSVQFISREPFRRSVSMLDISRKNIKSTNTFVYASYV